MTCGCAAGAIGPRECVTLRFPDVPDTLSCGCRCHGVGNLADEPNDLEEDPEDAEEYDWNDSPYWDDDLDGGP